MNARAERETLGHMARDLVRFWREDADLYEWVGVVLALLLVLAQAFLVVMLLVT